VLTADHRQQPIDTAEALPRRQQQAVREAARSVSG
jgi:hypothetical protein